MVMIPFRALLSELSKFNQTLSRTQNLHAVVIKNQLSDDPFFATRLVRFYAINEDLGSARQVFEGIPKPSVYLWNSIIRAYARVHQFGVAFGLFNRMLCSETKPDNFTFACILRACSERCDRNALRVVHAGVVVSGLGLDSVCASAIISAYSKLGCVHEANTVFCRILEPDLVQWNSMILGYGCLGDWEKGLELFIRMRRLGKWPDGYTVVGLVMGLGDSSLVETGQTIHGFCLKCGFCSNDYVNSALVSMYSRCQCMDSAFKTFCSLMHPDLVSWSSLITGFSQSRQYNMSLEFFRKMIFAGKKADTILIASALAASAHLTAAGPGSEIHGYAIRHECHEDTMVSSALIDMYAKCGILGAAIQVFHDMPKKNIVSYNSMISCLGLYGLAFEAFKLFEEVLKVGLRPDSATFSALLGACCHSGLVDEGRGYFMRMKEEYGILAETEHLVHMVKLLGMAGELGEAYEFILLHHHQPETVDSGIWGALLSGCNVHGNHNLAEIVARHLSKYKSEKSSYKVMLSNMYAIDRKWDHVQQLRTDAELIRKVPGITWIYGIRPSK